jgi:hypothetical protein
MCLKKREKIRLLKQETVFVFSPVKVGGISRSFLLGFDGQGYWDEAVKVAGIGHAYYCKFSNCLKNMGAISTV